MFALFVVGAIIWFAGEPARERKQLSDAIHNVPLLEAGEPREGTLVRVTGRVQTLESEVGGLLVAPLSDKPCVWYRSETSHSTDEVARRFVLDRARKPPLVIDATHARVAIAPLSRTDCYSNRALEYSLEHRDSDGGGVFMQETVITPGMRITVAGTLVREHVASTGERGYRDDPATQLVLAGSADHPLAITIADPL